MIAELLNRMIRLDPAAGQLLEPLDGVEVRVRVKGLHSSVVLFTAKTVVQLGNKEDPETPAVDHDVNAEVIAGYDALATLYNHGTIVPETLRIEGDPTVVAHIHTLLNGLHPDPKASVQVVLGFINKVIRVDPVTRTLLRPLLGTRVRLRVEGLQETVVEFSEGGLDLKDDHCEADVHIFLDRQALQAMLAGGRDALKGIQIRTGRVLAERLRRFLDASTQALAWAGVKMFDQVIKLDDQAPALLQPLNGRRVRLRLANLPDVVLGFTEQGVELQDNQGPSNAEIVFSTEALRALLTEGREALGRIRIRGEVGVVRQLNELFSKLDPNWGALLPSAWIQDLQIRGKLNAVGEQLRVRGEVVGSLSLRDVQHSLTEATRTSAQAVSKGSKELGGWLAKESQDLLGPQGTRMVRNGMRNARAGIRADARRLMTRLERFAQA